MIRKKSGSILLATVFLLLMSISSLRGQDKEIADILQYPYEVKQQELAGGQPVVYVDQGKGAPVVLIHGLGSYIPAWKRNIRELSKNHRVIALDLPGFGKSSGAVETYSIPFFARTVAQLQDSLGIEQAAWVGHSMGGQVVLEAAAAYPEKISRLILLAPAGFEQFSKQQGALMQQFVTPASVKATPDSMIRQTFRTTFYDFPEEAQFMADDRVAIRNASNFNRYANAYAGSVSAMIKGPVFEKLSSVSQPVLIIYGKQDALIPNSQLHPNLTTREVAESGAGQLPDSRLEMIDKAGHFVQFEQAEQVNNLILNFIEK